MAKRAQWKHKWIKHLFLHWRHDFTIICRSPTMGSHVPETKGCNQTRVLLLCITKVFLCVCGQYDDWNYCDETTHQCPIKRESRFKSVTRQIDGRSDRSSLISFCLKSEDLFVLFDACVFTLFSLSECSFISLLQFGLIYKLKKRENSLPPISLTKQVFLV